MTNNPSGYGKRIKELRNIKNWTQKELAKNIDVTSQVVSNWEREYTSPNHEDLLKMSKLFQVTTDYILLGNNNIKKINLNYDFESLNETFGNTLAFKNKEINLINKLLEYIENNGDELLNKILDSKVDIELLFNSNINFTYNNIKIDNHKQKKVLTILQTLLDE
ncbi:hypothetical protein bcere0007_54110 [Bacillus mycoides]|uniref:helix-turn-helix domain-containing protein n=1 Tax=Bacillus mycoides TaxID=1405 RepID=UPI0001A030A1|nr:helix-turn-helix transcriptional regulator [Bacillus mycoides]EEK70138.1 hypothetical protein bcere0007_54110 [Bacillus mycoides]